MNHRICVSKKITYASMFSLFVLLFVLLGQLTLQSNQAKNSRAATTNQYTSLKISITPTPPLYPPSCYSPNPELVCLTPIYEKGVNTLVLYPPQHMQSTQEDKSIKRYGIVMVNSVAGNNTVTYTVLKEFSASSIGNDELYRGNGKMLDLLAKKQFQFVIYEVPPLGLQQFDVVACKNIPATGLNNCKKHVFTVPEQD